MNTYFESDSPKTGAKNAGKSKSATLRWFKPIIQALRDLGGSATPADTRKKIIENEHLTEAELSETRGKSNINKFENEVAFARAYLVSGYIDNSVTGFWKLTDAGKMVDMTDELASEIIKNGNSAMVRARTSSKENALGDANVDTKHFGSMRRVKAPPCGKRSARKASWRLAGLRSGICLASQKKRKSKKLYRKIMIQMPHLHRRNVCYGSSFMI